MLLLSLLLSFSNKMVDDSLECQISERAVEVVALTLKRRTNFVKVVRSSNNDFYNIWKLAQRIVHPLTEVVYQGLIHLLAEV